MKRIALMTTAMTAAVLIMAGLTFADEMTRTTIEGRKHVITTPADPVEVSPSVQERSHLQIEQRSSTMTDPTEPSSVQERSHVRTEQRSSTVTSDPVLPPPSVQERSSDSYRTEERSSSTSGPLDPQEQTTTRSRVEERSSTTVPPPEVQQRTTIERRSSTVTSD
jgi:hypothetical protein